MSKEITSREEYEAWLKEHEKWVKEALKPRRPVVAGAGAPFFKKKGGGGGVICTFQGCEREAKEFCNCCYLPFCKLHSPPYAHNCTGYRLRDRLKELRGFQPLRHRLRKIGEELTETPTPMHSWRRISREELFKILAPHAKNYQRFREEFLDKAIRRTQNITTCDFINFIYARLVEELVKFSEKMGEVMVANQRVLDELASGIPSCDPRLAGLSFQWWLILRLLDYMSEMGYKIVYMDEAMNAVKVEGKEGALWLFFDSYTVYNSRPDILSVRYPSNILGGRVVEVKLSHRAFRDSIEQLNRYLRIWGLDGVMVAIGTPALYSDIKTFYVKVIDGISVMDEEKLQTALGELTSHLVFQRKLSNP